MKKMIVLALMSVAMVPQVQAQVVNTDAVQTDRDAVKMRPDTVTENGEWQKVIETTLTAKEGFKYGKQVLARIVPDCQRRMKPQDEEDAKIVCEVPVKLLEFFKLGKSKTEKWLTGSYTVTMTWLFKDGCYKVTAEDVKCSYQMRMPGILIEEAQNQPFKLMNTVTGAEAAARHEGGGRPRAATVLQDSGEAEIGR